MTGIRIARIAAGVVAVVALTWLLLSDDARSAWLVIGMFLIGIAGGAVMYWRWSPLIVPIAMLAAGEVRHRMDCPDCPAGDGPPWFVGMIIMVAIMLIPALGAAIGGGIVGLIAEIKH